MDLGLSGRIALVTAASEGLGLACAERLAREGCAIAICGRRPEVLEQARERLAQHGTDVLALQADLRDAGAIERLVERTRTHFGRIDILVANSGHVDYGGVEDLTDAQWQNACDLLLMSVVRLTRACIPVMRAGGGGDMVILGSATVKEPPPHLVASTVMRLGVVGLSKSLALSLAPDNIRVNLVAPGYFDAGRVTRRIGALVDEKRLSREEAAAEVSGAIPLKRIGSPGELAELVAFVASRNAGFMTGSMITIDGGGTRALF
jgi:3-oxoacyl-[acyl-carrier protein] reductase